MYQTCNGAETSLRSNINLFFHSNVYQCVHRSFMQVYNNKKYTQAKRSTSTSFHWQLITFEPENSKTSQLHYVNKQDVEKKFILLLPHFSFFLSFSFSFSLLFVYISTFLSSKFNFSISFYFFLLLFSTLSINGTHEPHATWQVQYVKRHFTRVTSSDTRESK